MRVNRKAWYVWLVYGKYPPSSVSLCKLTWLLVWRFLVCAFASAVLFTLSAVWWAWFSTEGWVAVWGPLAFLAILITGVAVQDAVDRWRWARSMDELKGSDRPESLIVARVKAWKDKVCPQVRIE